MFHESVLNDKTLDRFICNYTSCPISCKCYYQPTKMKVVLHCAGRNLLEMTDLNLKELDDRLVYREVKLKYEESKAEVNLQHNSISRLSAVSYLGKISLLNLSFNNLKDIDPDILLKIPKNAVIDLRSNPMLRKLPKEIASFESSNVNISFLTLDCTCEDEMYTWLPDWIKASGTHKQIDVFCVIDEENVPASDISKQRLGCTNFIPLYITATVFVILLILGVLAIYCRYELYLLCRNRCQSDNSNEMHKYHLYIAYDDQDAILATWIIEKFCPSLERRGYVVFLPSRDTRPGTPKEEEIRGAIKRSQNVVFFLTDDFVSGKDLWMMIEYRSAWNNFKENVSRKIILVDNHYTKRGKIQINSLRAIFSVGILIHFHEDVINKVCRHLTLPKGHDDFHII
ncbi:hypothetical protein FSP39_004852 [Pinctada imbricata]|uniref:TIR domain-containing protein n=1 Tax=Pinctada imbricata TaxID=66713 RepID=A0AA89BUV7_PINIB|nr:hypothetical protein FSP39_004852 [Pinctada imbricata]